MRWIGFVAWAAATAATAFGAAAWKAPEIEADIRARAEAAMAATPSPHPIAVAVDGRDVTVTGLADAPEVRDLLLSAAGVDGARGPFDAIELLERLDPYPFAAAKTPDGRLSVTGAAPTAAVRDAMVGALEAVYGARADIDLRLAAGAPGGDRELVALSGVGAVDLLDSGVFRMEGETASLEGRSTSEEAIEAARSAGAGIGGLPWTVDIALDLPQVRPFTFEAASTADGVALSGHAPDEEARDALVGAAAALRPGAPFAADLGLAAGAPSADWPRFVADALGGLGALTTGTLSVADFRATLEGEAATLDQALEAAERLREAAARAKAAGAASAEYETALALADYRFRALKAPDGQALVEGAAPDGALGARLQSATQGAFPAGGSFRYVTATGVDAADWEARVVAGLGALGRLETGELEVTRDGLRLVGRAPDAATRDAITTALGAGATLDLAVAEVASPPPSPSPPPMLEAKKSADGALRLRGLAPNAQARTALVAAAGEAAEGAFAEALLDVAEPPAAAPTADGWRDAALLRLEALDALAEGALTIEGDTARLEGVAADAAAQTRARALFEAAGGGAVAVTLAPPPVAPAEVTLGLAPIAGFTLDGLLPAGLEPAEAQRLLGLEDGVVANRLTSGGAGDADRFRGALGALGEFLPEFERLEVALGSGAPRIAGETLSETDRDQVEALLRAGLAGFGAPDIAVTPAPRPPEGAKRVNPVDGRAERFTGGFWLPELEAAAATAQSCAARTSEVLAAGDVRFLLGSAELDVRARRIVNELAAIVNGCLDGAALALEIGGHTDDTGGEALNRRLSEARAAAVRVALIERGAPDAALVALGYGPSRPVADNATEEGRAANRRITFEWRRAP